MVWTRPSSESAPCLPTFTYIGRLKDSRKGLDVFLDAIEILWLDQRYDFRVWIVGGNERDVAWLRNVIRLRPTLWHGLRERRLEIWGRVESDALPEILSRSTALVVPSFREQFGIVAIEAMMCSCPVVASKVGGLQDIVVQRRTGILFDLGNSSALVAALDALARSPQYARWLGNNARIWARSHFNLENICGALESILMGGTPRRLLQAENRSTFQKMLIDRTLEAIEARLDCEIVDVRNLSTGHCVSMAIDTLKERVFAKIYSPRPSSISCLHTVPQPGVAEGYPGEMVQMTALLAKELRVVPEVRVADSIEGFIVQEFLDPVDISTVDDLVTAALDIRSELSDFSRRPDCGLEKALADEVARLDPDSDDDLENFDRLVAEIHSNAFETGLKTRRLHPQVELLRIRSYLSRAKWLPLEFRTRATATIGMLCAKPLTFRPLTFGHGSLKAAHFLAGHDGRLKLCDFDKAGFYCGPQDLAHCLWDWFNLQGGGHIQEILRRLTTAMKHPKEAYLGICWTVAFRLNLDIFLMANGDWNAYRDSLRDLFVLNESIRDSFYEQEPLARTEFDQVITHQAG